MSMFPLLGFPLSEKHPFPKYISPTKKNRELFMLSILFSSFVGKNNHAITTISKNRLHLSYTLDIITAEVVKMMVNTDYLVPMTEANQNFSKVVRTVDENGLAVILKNNKPRYVVVDFDEYNTISAAMQMRKAKIDSVADKLIDENMEALSELAK